MIGEMKEPLLEKNITLNVSDEAYESLLRKKRPAASSAAEMSAKSSARILRTR